MNDDKNDKPFECGICHGTNIRYYHGMLGYEAMRCEDCLAEAPIGIADAGWIAYVPDEPRRQ